MKYEEAIKKLEAISQQLEDGELDIDVLSAKLREAQQLIQFCRQQLTAVDEEIQKTLAEGQK